MILKGKRGVIMGIANQMSIAYGIAKDLKQHGAEFMLTYQSEIFKKRIVPIAEELSAERVIECDVSNEESITKAFDEIKDHWGSIDFIVHAIAFSDKNELRGKYVDTSKENFLNTLDVSCFSFVSVARRAQSFMASGGSMLCLSYYGAEKYIPHYNVMGVAKAALEASVRYMSCDLGEQNIRVNAISAGPLKTLAASGIGDFKYIFKWNEENTPLKRNTTLEDVGRSATYLISDLSSGVTGEVLHVDSGYHTIGMKMVSEEDLEKIRTNQKI